MSTLNKEQAAAVNSTASKILCLAGAGTGKTFCMISRISRIVEEGTPPANILVLTFTRAAAFEMKERYQRTHPHQQIPEFRTFHSFCYSVMISDSEVRSRLGYSQIPKIADAGAIKRISTSAKMQCGINLSDKQLNGKVALTPRQQQDYQIYQKCLTKLLKSENLITFDTLCYDVCELFVIDDPTIQKYKERYHYIFVDEFQDTDPRQYDFVSSFPDANIFVVGDALQSIYSFRGADSSIIKSLADDEEWETIKLFQNYRSTEEICEFANKNSTYASNAYRIEIHANNHGSTVSVLTAGDCDYNNIVDAHTLSVLRGQLSAVSGTSAILCKTNKEVAYIRDWLSSNGIAYSAGKQDADILHILKSITDNSYMVDWLSTFLTADRYAEYIRSIAIDDSQSPAEIFVKKFGDAAPISSRLEKVFKIRNILRGPGLPMQKCTDILALFNIKDILVSTAATNVAELIEYLTEIVTNVVAADLYVGTIHSSKGLEYDNVFLVGVDSTSFQLTSEESRNLYYVGITRAKYNLVVFKA